MNNMLGRVNIRMKLEDFLDKKVEDDILKGLAEISTISNGIISLILWFDDENSEIDWKTMIDSMKDAKHYKTSILAKSKIKQSDFVWFDMRASTDVESVSNNYRFQYRYNSLSQIPAGLRVMGDALEFFKNKPPKEKKVERKQKRNDV
jgi:hypothetical protein